MKIRIRYRRARVTVEHEKTNFCQACGAEGRTEMHHYLYAYQTSRVREWPALALDNSIELCFNCHKIANALRICTDSTKRAHVVIVALLKKQRMD